MATLRADKKNYKKAFTTHANSYDKWSIGSDYSRRLLLCYCVECGLKCLIMQTDNINTVSQASDETLRVLHSHDFRTLLNKATSRPATINLSNFPRNTVTVWDLLITINYADI